MRFVENRGMGIKYCCARQPITVHKRTVSPVAEKKINRSLGWSNLSMRTGSSSFSEEQERPLVKWRVEIAFRFSSYSGHTKTTCSISTPYPMLLHFWVTDAFQFVQGRLGVRTLSSRAVQEGRFFSWQRLRFRRRKSFVSNP